jgi:hypothetical protein
MFLVLVSNLLQNAVEALYGISFNNNGQSVIPCVCVCVCVCVCMCVCIHIYKCLKFWKGKETENFTLPSGDFECMILCVACFRMQRNLQCLQFPLQFEVFLIVLLP